MLDDLTPTAGVERGCGRRVHGGIYISVPLSNKGVPLDTFLLCPPRPVDREALRLEPIGVQLVEVAGVTHVFDWVGASHYPNVADMIAECVLPSEIIVTETGPRPISGIQVGDRVLTHRGRYRSVTDVMQRPYIGPLLSIRTYGGNNRLKVTSEHPVLRATASEDGRMHRSFVSACEIVTGDWLCFPVEQATTPLDFITISYTRDHQEGTHGNLSIPNEVRAMVDALRHPKAGLLRAHQLQLVTRLAEQASWTYREIKQAMVGEVYRFESGLARTLTALVKRGVLAKEAGTYRVTALGHEVRELPYMAWSDVGRATRLDRGTAAKLQKPHTPVVKEWVLPVNEDLMVLIGYYLAEGSTANKRPGSDPSHRHLIEFSFGLGDEEAGYAREVARAARRLGFGTKVGRRKGCACTIVHGRALAEWLHEEFGGGAHRKRIPGWVRRLPPDLTGHLTRTYMNGDGHRRRGTEVGTTVSIALADGIRALLLRQGRTSSISTHEKSGFSSSRPLYRVASMAGSPGRLWSDGTYLYMRVRSVETETYRGDVWNISVDEDESYCTLTRAVHNCRRFGASRRISSSTDFGRLTPESRLVLLHERAIITNADRLRSILRDEVRERRPDALGWAPLRFCPARLLGHMALPIDGPQPGEMYQSLYWEDVNGGEAVLDPAVPWRSVDRTVGSTTYRARRRPDGFVPDYELAIFATLPIHHLTVIRDPEGGRHHAAFDRASLAQLPVVIEEE